MTLFEVDEAANRIRKEVDEDANIIFGSSVEEDLNGRLRVSVVATGIDAAALQAQAPVAATAAPPRPEGFTLVPGSRPPAGGRPAVMTSPVAPPVAVPRRAVGGAAPMVLRAPVSQAAAPPAAAPLGPVGVPAPEEAEGAAAPYASAPPPATSPVEQARRPAGPLGAAASTVPGVGNGLRRIFQEMTGAGLMRRNAPPQPPIPLAPRGADPARPSGGGAAAQQRPPQPDEIGLDIPTFLRRQSN
jgi:cell division protein FtsZ